MDDTRIIVASPKPELSRACVVTGLLAPPIAALACKGLSLVSMHLFINFGIGFGLDLLSVALLSFPVQIVLCAFAFVSPIVLIPNRLLVSAILGGVELALVLAICRGAF